MSKKRIFINSTGRTATQFFAKYLRIMIADSISLHEPGTPWFSKPMQLMGQIKDYGVYHLSIGQNKNTHSMYKLSRDYVAKDISKKNACENILKINDKVDALCEEDIVVYSSGHIYGLLGLLDEVYKDSRFVFIIRDPRDWIESALHKVEYSLYGPLEMFYRKISLQPSCFSDDPYLLQWKTLSKFEKYCWFYNKLNQIAIKDMEGKTNFRVFRYEDIFLSENKAENFKDMLDFATDFESGRVESTFYPDLIDKKVDSKQSTKAAWEAWTCEQAHIMMKHCGDSMKEYGYGTEELWKQKIS
ncbi:MAG: hypothetical protein R3Y47_10340 [Lachnospiraceae bacterium]